MQQLTRSRYKLLPLIKNTDLWQMVYLSQHSLCGLSVLPDCFVGFVVLLFFLKDCLIYMSTALKR